MTYKEMNYKQLLDEEVRVKVLLATDKRPFTQRQNRIYLEKIQRRIKEVYLNENRT